MQNAVSRTLDNLYVSDTRDPKKEELERRIEELERQRTAPEQAGNTMEEKMALMEKSYELAARYGGRQPRQVRPAQDERERRAARPVRRMQSRAVSSLSRPSGNGEAAAFSGERNTGFHTPVGKTLTSERNTIEACVHGTQTVSDGQALRIRLLEPMVVDDRFIPKGTVLVGGTICNIIACLFDRKGISNYMIDIGGTGIAYYPHIKKYMAEHHGLTKVVLTNRADDGSEISPMYAIVIGLHKQLKNRYK